MDPLIGRMMAADPLVSNPSDGQAWNRYSYVGNDPLNLTDPTGYSWFSDFFNSIGSFFASIIKAVVQIVVTAVLTVALGPIGTAIGATWLTGALAAAGAAAVVTGLSGGNLGDMLKAAAVAGITAGLFYGAGELTGNFNGILDANLKGHGPLLFGSDAHLFNIVSHAAIGCGSSVASGGDCASGAFAAGAGSFFGPIIATQSYTAGLAITAAIGGTASVIAGGKFENGAVTAAFGYMYNAAGKRGIGDNNGPPLDKDPPGTVRVPMPPGVALVLTTLKGAQLLFDSLLNPGIDTTIYVIGRLPDTAVAKDWPNHSIIDIADWSLAKNDAWIQSIIDRQATVYTASPQTYHNVWDVVNNRPTVYGREIQQLKNAGYTQQGDYLHPPSR